MAKKHLTFEDVYLLPISIDEFCPIHIKSNNNITTFNIISDDMELVKDILSVINGESDKKFEDVEYQDEIIKVNGKKIFLIRGWGHLTGTLQLDPNNAIKIQDDFCNWMIKKLKA